MLPAVALTLGVIFLHETVDWRIFAGSVLVVGGVILAGVVRRRPAVAAG
jgi:drug/metabolite transporter (DMT)-like permease